jgi:hypothetical protein
VIVLKVRPYEEKRFRYFLYNEKVRRAIRLDAVEQACLLLPEDHGLIFSRGYYLQTGELKQFEIQTQDMVFENAGSPNGEDYLYVFHNRDGVCTCCLVQPHEQKVGTRRLQRSPSRTDAVHSADGSPRGTTSCRSGRRPSRPN